MSFPQSGKIVVVGAGVIGLTIASTLAERGYRVKLIAEHLPGDLSIDYTSPWAGAHWRSVASNDNATLQEYDAISYKKFMTLAHLLPSQETGIVIAPSVDYYETITPETESPWFQHVVNDFEFIPTSLLPLKAKAGFQYTTVLINPLRYLQWLMDKFIRAGGQVQKKRLASLQQVFESDTAMVVNCTGMGSLSLEGVNDTNVFPTRGQTVVVRAPHILKTFNYAGKDEFTYVIPRSDGSVVLGGTLEPHDFNSNAVDTTAQSILRRAVQLCPALVQNGKQPDVIRHSVGLRPTRVGGPRIEVENMAIPGCTRTMPVMHAYGHGGFGFQSSWGTAERVAVLVASTLMPTAKM